MTTRAAAATLGAIDDLGAFASVYTLRYLAGPTDAQAVTVELIIKEAAGARRPLYDIDRPNLRGVRLHAVSHGHACPTLYVAQPVYTSPCPQPYSPAACLWWYAACLQRRWHRQTTSQRVCTYSITIFCMRQLSAAVQQVD